MTEQLKHLTTLTDCEGTPLLVDLSRAVSIHRRPAVPAMAGLPAQCEKTRLAIAGDGTFYVRETPAEIAELDKGGDEPEAKTPGADNAHLP